MLFISPEDFYEKVKHLTVLTRQEELEYAEKMRSGDPDARQAILQSYLPQVAATVRRLGRGYQSLELILRCCAALEKAADSFNFLQNGETFSHRLSWWLRQTVTGYIADRRS